LARQANVNIETIRYYERRGLISEPPRNKSGHRQYTVEAVRRTDFIKRCQTLGFSLKEIEIFSAGCPVCQEAIATVQNNACASCDVTILDMNDPVVSSRANSTDHSILSAMAQVGKKIIVGKGAESQLEIALFLM
jgi:DNA-binding transcriptional MerR regulator